MKFEHAFYKTKDGSLDIEFMLIDLGDEIGWRAYVMTEIDYKQRSRFRSDSYTDTHLFLDNNQHRYIDKSKDFPYVCRIDPIYDIEVMRDVAAAWCEITAYYIKHGGDFAAIQRLLQKKGVI